MKCTFKYITTELTTLTEKDPTDKDNFGFNNYKVKPEYVILFNDERVIAFEHIIEEEVVLMINETPDLADPYEFNSKDRVDLELFIASKNVVLTI